MPTPGSVSVMPVVSKNSDADGDTICGLKYIESRKGFVGMILWELSRSGGGGRGFSGAEGCLLELLDAESGFSRFGATGGELALSNASGELIPGLPRLLDAGLSMRSVIPTGFARAKTS